MITSEDAPATLGPPEKVDLIPLQEEMQSTPYLFPAHLQPDTETPRPTGEGTIQLDSLVEG